MTRFDGPEWAVLHGDTAQSPVWAVLDDDCNTFDLTGWFVSAQVRDSVEDTTPRFTWIVGEGVDIGAAIVDTPRRRRVKTSTVNLYLRPSDFEQFPRRYRGIVEVEIASDGSGAPEERHTIARFPFSVEPDVAR